MRASQAVSTKAIPERLVLFLPNASQVFVISLCASQVLRVEPVRVLPVDRLLEPVNGFVTKESLPERNTMIALISRIVV